MSGYEDLEKRVEIDFAFGTVVVCIDLKGEKHYNDADVSQLCQHMANRIVISLELKSLNIRFDVTQNGLPWVKNRDMMN